MRIKYERTLPHLYVYVLCQLRILVNPIGWYNDLRMVVLTKDEPNHTVTILSLMLVSEDLVKNPKIWREILRLRK